MAIFMRRLTFSRMNFCLHRHNLKNNIHYHCQQQQISKISGDSNFDENETDNATNGDEEKIHLKSVYDTLYPGHITTSALQKSLLAIGSGIAVFMNPARADMLCSLAETTGVPALNSIKLKMEKDPAGQKILEERPLMTSETLNLDYMGSLPEGTLGKEYWHFLNKNGFSPDDRLPVSFIDDPDLMYIMLRYRQCHDIVHTMIDMPPNMLGEVVVKWYEMIHTKLPMCTSAALLGHLRLGPKHRKKFLTSYLPWVLKTAPKAKNLMNIYYEKHWEQDLNEFRQEMNIERAPQLTKKTGQGTKS